MVRQEFIMVLAWLVVVSSSKLTIKKVSEITMNSEKPSECEKSSSFGRKTTGVNKADLGAYPSMAAIGYTKEDKEPRFVEDPLFDEGPLVWRCGGSLISDRYVITAASCLDESLLCGFKVSAVRLGDHDLNDNVTDNARPLDVEVESIIKHPQYNFTNEEHDIGLIKLKERVKFDGYKKPISLPTEQFPKKGFYDGEVFKIVGWGGSKEEGSTTVLKEAAVCIKSCQNGYTAADRIDDSVICSASAGNDVCVGDCGGPLIMMKKFSGKTRYYLAGVVSNRVGYGNPGYQSVYTKVSYYMDWIVKNLES